MKKNKESSDKLKQDILFAADRLFKKHGYDKTTIQMIAAELYVAQGTVPYHFKNKHRIAHTLLEVFNASLCEYVQQNLKENFNYYLFHNIVDIYFWREIMKSESKRSLFFHKTLVDIWEKENVPLVENKYIEITKDYKKELTKNEIHMIALIDIGARNRFFKEFIEAEGSMTVDEYCYNQVYMTGLLSGLDEATIKKNTERAFEFADSHTHSITFL